MGIDQIQNSWGNNCEEQDLHDKVMKNTMWRTNFVILMWGPQRGPHTAQVGCPSVAPISDSPKKFCWVMTSTMEKLGFEPWTTSDVVRLPP